jgi:hypothetical protein
VLETSSSPASARAPIRACADVDRHPADVVAEQLDLAGVDPDPDLDPDRRQLLADGSRTADRPRRAVEGGQEAVAHRLDLAAAVELELAADDRVVALEQLAPARVPERGGARRGVHDVREQHRRKHPVGLADAARAGEEALCLVEDRVGVLREVGVVAPLQLDEARSRDHVCQVTAAADRDPVVAAVQHKRGNRHCLGDRAHVDASHGVDQRVGHPR